MRRGPIIPWWGPGPPPGWVEPMAPEPYRGLKVDDTVCVKGHTCACINALYDGHMAILDRRIGDTAHWDVKYLEREP